MDFFRRLQSLRESRPCPAILTVRSENSGYCPYHANGKNCYLLIGHNYGEDCYYGFWVGFSQDCVDSAFLEKCTLCYECMDCKECYNCNYSQECAHASDCEYCYDCRGTESCFGCVNLRNKKYCIFNEQFTREEYRERVRILKQNLPAVVQRFEALKASLPRITFQGYQTENVFGDHIYNSRSVFFSYDVSEAEDCAYLYNARGQKDCLDVCYTSLSELNYMCHSAVSLQNCNFCNVCWFSQNLEYCEYVFNSHDCFGCVSRNHAEYEILNQKYLKEEYFKKVAQIKNELQQEESYGRWWWPSPYEGVKPFCSFMA